MTQEKKGGDREIFAVGAYSYMKNMNLIRIYKTHIICFLPCTRPTKCFGKQFLVLSVRFQSFFFTSCEPERSSDVTTTTTTTSTTLLAKKMFGFT